MCVPLTHSVALFENAASNVKNVFTLINNALFSLYISCAHNAMRIV